MNSRSTNFKRGFTRLDLTIVVVTLLLSVAYVFFFYLPSLTGSRRSPRIMCVSNLKQIGLSVRMWANDNNDVLPSPVSEPIRANDTNRVLRFALALSNELNTPKVLTCPQEKKQKKAATWTELTSSNISYFLALGAENGNPNSLLAGDRNITGGISLTPHFRIFMTNTPAGWTEEPHQHAGNILLADGSAQQVNSNGLWKAFWLKSNRVARLALP